MKRQRGFTVAFLALSIVVLFAMAAIAVDLGVLYTARTSAQHAADAAALAGAYTFILGAGVTQPDAAVNAAITTAAQNKILGTAVTISGANVTVDQTNYLVTVRVPRTGANGIEVFFAKVIGWDTVDVQTVATAQAYLAGRGSASRCIKPIYIPNTIFSALDPAVACTNHQVIFNPDGSFSSWFQGLANSYYGQSMGIRPVQPNQALAPGQFYSLDFGSGGNTYRCAWGKCLNDCGGTIDEIACGQPYPVETGDMVGPTKQGVSDLIGNPPDTWGGKNSLNEWYFYPGGSSTASLSSGSVVVAPVWDDCTQNVVPGTHGQAVSVIGFMNLFVDGYNNSTKNVMVHFMDATGCPAISAGSGGGSGGSGGSSGSGGTPTGPLGVPVRLVQTPTS